MITLYALFVFVMISFGLAWHNEPPRPPANRSTKTFKP